MKKCIAVLVAMVLFSMSLLQVNAAGLLFIDVKDEQYFDVLTQLGVLNVFQDEEGFFDGRKEVSRGEAATAIAGLIGIKPSLNSNIGETFIDVLASEPHSGCIAAMYSVGAMVGSGDNLFRPYDSIQTVGFVKAVLVALGYQWRAEAVGGYPSGYLKLANEVGLLDDVTISNDEILTRNTLFTILYNALDVQVYRVVGVSPDTTHYETSKYSTLLTEYHDIYEETGIVNSNSMTSLNAAFSANEKNILIGNSRVTLQGDTSIWSYLGQNVTYYYRQEENDTKKVLVAFVAEDNEIVTLSENMIDKISNNVIEYLDVETGKVKKLHYTVGTDVVYNNGREALNLKATLENFTGTAQFIDNDEDSVVDVIIIYDYIYDEVISVDVTGEVLYCESSSYDLDATEYWNIDDGLGSSLTLDSLSAGTVLAISKSLDGKFIDAIALPSTVTGRVSQMGDESVMIEDTEYVISSGCPAACQAKIKLGSTFTFVLNIVGEVVYVKDASNDDLKLGYLITYGAESNAFDSKIFLKILTAGTVKIYETKEKLQINGVVVEPKDVVATLRNLKNQLSLASDGAVSQVIRYRVDANGIVTAVYTAKTAENDELALKYNSAGSAVLCRKFYGVATVSSNKEFLGNSGTTVYVVPKNNQDTLPDDYYRVSKLDTEIQDNRNYVVETYMSGDNIIPTAIVVYPETAVAGGAIPADANIMMIESIEKVVNKDGAPVTKFNVYHNGNKLSYLSEDTMNVTDLGVGDTVVFQFSPLDEVQKYGKVYDASEGQFCMDLDNNVTYEAASLAPGSSGNPPGRSIMKYSLYRRQGDYIMATNKGFSNMDTALDNMYAVDLSRHKSFPMYDPEKDEVRLVTTDALVEYVRDQNNYSELLILYYWNSIYSVVLYK